MIRVARRSSAGVDQRAARSVPCAIHRLALVSRDGRAARSSRPHLERLPQHQDQRSSPPFAAVHRWKEVGTSVDSNGKNQGPQDVCARVWELG